MVTALNHPLRRSILRCLQDGWEVRSPRELAALLDCDLSDVAHHCGVLQEVKAIVLADTDVDGGSTEHIYESTVAEDGGFCLVLLVAQKCDENS